MQNVLTVAKPPMVKMKLRSCLDTETWAMVARYLSLGAVIAGVQVDMMMTMMNNHMLRF